VKLLWTGQHWDLNNGRFRGVAGFVRLLLQRIVREGLKKSADIQGGPVFLGCGLEKFHCSNWYMYVRRRLTWTVIRCSLILVCIRSSPASFYRLAGTRKDHPHILCKQWLLLKVVKLGQFIHVWLYFLPKKILFTIFLTAISLLLP
jgi:hypothetical protein